MFFFIWIEYVCGTNSLKEELKNERFTITEALMPQLAMKK